jgi:hypothetical protein
MPADHNREITVAAKAILKPMGCVRKGRSRTWLDDRGWWLGVVEFQPSGWSKGSYLNVAASFLWDDDDHISFDDMAGEKPWRDAIAGESFLDKATELTTQARAALLELRKRHANVALSAAWLSQSECFSNWTHFHAAIAQGLSGNVGAAQKHFHAAILSDSEIDWVARLNQRCRSLADLVTDEKRFATTIADTIQRTRERMQLPRVELDLTRSATGRP